MTRFRRPPPTTTSLLGRHNKVLLVSLLFISLALISKISPILSGLDRNNEEFESEAPSVVDQRESITNENNQESKQPQPPQQQQQQQKTNVNRREFVEYQSSAWEQYWVDNVDRLVAENAIDQIRRPYCDIIANQSDLVRRFFDATCTNFPSNNNNTSGGWCMHNDLHKPTYFNRQTGLVRDSPPPEVGDEDFSEWRPVYIGDDDADVFSRFVYRDGLTGETYYEYVQPLVSTLRHPVTCCDLTYRYQVQLHNPSRPKCRGTHYFMEHRGQLVPPPRSLLREQDGGKFPDDTKYFYFDAGASDWLLGAGGPSLSYFHTLWSVHHGMHFDSIDAYEASTPSEDFYKTVPEQYKPFVHYHNVYVRSQPEEEEGEGDARPFLPFEITSKARKEDYVMFKLDIDSPGVEEANVHYLLANTSGILVYIDEFVYEFHLHKSKYTLADWYRYFLKLRKAGVRAHSWI